MDNIGTHIHIVLWAFDHFDPETGNCTNNTTLDLIAGSIDQAISRAQEIMPGKQYRIHSVIEHFDGSCK